MKFVNDIEIKDLINMLLSTVTQKKIQFFLALFFMALIAISTYLTVVESSLFNTFSMTISSGMFLVIVLYNRN